MAQPTPNKYDLIVFDLDGTLLDTIEDIATSYRIACEEYGYPLPPTKEVTLWIGQGHDVAIENCYQWLKRELDSGSLFPKFADKPELASLSADEKFKLIYAEREDFKQTHKHYYHEIGNKTSKLFPGVFNSLARLKASGVTLAVLTNKMKTLATTVLADIKIAEFFDAVIGDGDLQNNKPDPEGILVLMQRFNLHDKSRVLMVGDSKNDINAGLAAGVEVLGLTYGYNYGEPIALSNPTYVADEFAMVVALNEGKPTSGSEF